MPARKVWIPIFIVLGAYVITSYLSRRYEDSISSYIESSGHILGAGIYMGALIISTVIAPLASLPFISVIANIWGSLIAVILTVIGSAIGGLIAFSIAKKYGQPLVKKLAPTEDVEEIRKLIPARPEHAFWMVVFLHLIIPSDALSYALGLFSNIGTKTYFAAMSLGITPLIMVLAYAGTVSLQYQIMIIIAGIISILFLLRLWLRHLNK